MGTLYTRLSSITGEMSPESIEHHIARVMLEHIHQLNNISIGAMADLCSVSKSTISKFVKQLGFEDYKEFKAEAYSRGKREVYIKDLNTINITDYILQKGTEEYLDVLFSDIRYLFFNTDSKKIDHLVTLIHDYEEVAAFGEGYSETAAFALVCTVHTQNRANLLAKLVHAVAVALLAEFAKAAQVLADLRGGDAHALAEQARRNAHDALGVQIVEIAVVTGKTPDDGVGNFAFFHKERSFVLGYCNYTSERRSCQFF